MKTYTEADIRAILKRLIAQSNQKTVAEQLGYSPQYISDVVRGRRRVSETFCALLGFELVARYKRVKGK